MGNRTCCSETLGTRRLCCRALGTRKSLKKSHTCGNDEPASVDRHYAAHWLAERKAEPSPCHTRLHREGRHAVPQRERSQHLLLHPAALHRRQDWHAADSRRIGGCTAPCGCLVQAALQVQHRLSPACLRRREDGPSTRPWTSSSPPACRLAPRRRRRRPAPTHARWRRCTSATRTRTAT